MKVNIEKKPKAQIEITVELSFEEFKPFLNKGAQRISQRTQIEGFRPGKAPYEIVKNQAGEMAIYEEAAEEAVPKTYYETLEKEKIMTIGQPKISVEKLAPGNPFIYKATAALFPNVEIGNLSKLQISRRPVEVKDEEINRVIDQLRKMRAKETLVEREVQKGDRVELDFDISLDRIPIENGAQRKYPMIVGEGYMIPGFEEQLLGMKKDQTKEFKLKFPKEYHAKSLAGKECDFKVKLLAVYKIELPEVNDQFVQTIGKFKNLEEFKNQIRKNLEAEAKIKEDERAEIEMLEKIVEISKFDEIPDILVDNESHRMVHELEHSIEEQGLKWADYLNNIKKKESDLLLDFSAGAIKRVKVALISRKIALDKKIEATPDEIDLEIEKVSKMIPQNTDAQENIRQPGYREYVSNMIINRKVVDGLKKEIIN